MEFLISAKTDVGIVKNTNQDSLSVKLINTPKGKMVFAVLCDGMGGLSKGETASGSLINAFNKWLINSFPSLCCGEITESELRLQWESIIVELNNKLKVYGVNHGVSLGTTAVVMLLTQNSYFIMNVGDSRAYEVSDRVSQITVDQTFIAREIALGNMTPEQAETDSRRNVLLQCVGASDVVVPDMFCGKIEKNAVYMLCSDGFRHEISSDEILEYLNPNSLANVSDMESRSLALIELNKQRMERDNISVVLVRTY